MKVLITGATGTIGRHLIAKLLEKGIQVHILSRNLCEISGVKTFIWDINRSVIDSNCLQNVDCIVHLAGKGISDGNWSVKNQQEIIDSRVKSMQLLDELMCQQNHQVKKIVSASGLGFYGGDNGEEILTEESKSGTDFLGKCCMQWEKTVQETAHNHHIDSCIFRTGLVLSVYGGALPVLIKPIKYGMGTSLGTGDQMVSWVHIEDVVQAYFEAITSDFKGVFNLCAPNLVDFKTLAKVIASRLHRPFWRVSIPKFVLKCLLGSKHILVTGSTNASSKKIESLGFTFKYPQLEQALENLL